MGDDRPGPPGPGLVRAYTFAIGAVALGLAVFGATLGDFDGPPWFALPVFTALGVGAGYVLFRYRYRDEVSASDLFEAVLLPVLFLYPAPAVLAFVLVAQGAAEAINHNSRLKGAFNVAMWSFAASAGSVAFAAITELTTLPRTGAIVLSLVLVTLANQVAFLGVMKLHRRVGLRALLRDFAPGFVPVWIRSWAANVAVGLLFLSSFLHSPWSLVLFFVPLLLLHMAARGFGLERTNRARLEGLQRATHALAEPVDPRQAVGRFLNEVRQSFEAEVVDLVVCEDGSWVRYRVAGGEPGMTHFGPADQPSLAVAAAELDRADRITTSSADVTLGRLLRVEGWRDCVAAPVRIKDEAIGALCAYNRGGLEGFEDGELAVMDALAGEAASAIQRSQLLEAILGERRKLSEIVESTSDGIFTLATDGAIRSWNTAMANLTGYEAGSVLETQNIGLLRPRDEGDDDVLLERWANGDVSLPARVQVRTKDGASRWLDCSYTTSEGEERLLIVVARDITQVHEVNRLKQDFVSIVSHELRTPIAPIKGFASTLLQAEDQVDDATRRLALESILRQSQRLENLIMNLLEVSKIEAGAAMSDVAPVDVVSACRRVIDELKPAWPKRVIELDADESTICIGRELWIDQVVTNLLSNALKYAPDDAPVHIRVKATDEAVHVSVIDRGPGIPEQERVRIFERFERLHQHDMQAGTGLGLYISRHLAEAMGGSLSLQSTLGEGSTFTLTLRSATRPRLVAVS